MLKKCYLEPCLLQVLSTFCVLISVINPIGTLRSRLYYLSHFVAIFVVIQAKYANVIKPTQTRRIQVELRDVCQKSEGNWREKLLALPPV